MVYIFVFPVDIQHHLLRGYNQHPRRENKPYENTSGLDFYFFKKNTGVSTPRAWSGPGHPLQYFFSN